MAAPALFYNPKPQFFTSTGTMASGYQLFFYEPGTTTKKDTYTTSALSVANSNPIVLNSRGEASGDIYLDGSYKVVFTSNTDSDPPVASIWSVDNVTSLQQLLTTLSKTSNYTVTISDKDKFILCDATAGTITLTLPAAATAGNGFSIGAKKTDSGTNTVIIDANGAETIDGNTTYVLTAQNDGVKIITNGTAWYTMEAHPQTMLDKNGNEVLSLGTTAAAVNEVRITNAATTVAPSIKSLGESNIGLLLLDSNGNEEVILASTAAAVNEVTITNAATGSGPTVAATGGDTNIPITVKGKGTGAVKLGQATTTGVQLEADQPILDSSGNEYIIFQKAATAVNQYAFLNAATGAGPQFLTSGDDTNITGNMVAKGTGGWDMYGGTTNTTPVRFIISATAKILGHNINSLSTTRTVTWPDTDISQFIVQRVNTQTGAVATGTTVIPYDDTIPQNTEGDQYMTLAITPKNTNNILYIEVITVSANSVAAHTTTALFQDATAGALAAGAQFTTTGGGTNNTKFIHKMTAGTTSATTFKVRIGTSTAATVTFNGTASGRIFGGVMASSITITEVSP